MPTPTGIRYDTHAVRQFVLHMIDDAANLGPVNIDKTTVGQHGTVIQRQFEIILTRPPRAIKHAIRNRMERHAILVSANQINQVGSPFSSTTVRSKPKPEPNSTTLEPAGIG